MHSPIATVKRIPLEIRAAVLAVSAAAIVLGVTLGFSIMMETYTGRHAAAVAAVAHRAPPPLVARGQHLYLMNCAHCHAPDARGDEGPDLHGVTKSDAPITRMILNGVKGKMPRFGAKFKDADVKALIAFIRSLD